MIILSTHTHTHMHTCAFAECVCNWFLKDHYQTHFQTCTHPFYITYYQVEIAPDTDQIGRNTNAALCDGVVFLLVLKSG